MGGEGRRFEAGSNVVAGAATIAAALEGFADREGGTVVEGAGEAERAPAKGVKETAGLELSVNNAIMVG